MTTKPVGGALSVDPYALVQFTKMIRNVAIEEIAVFAETHYCVIKDDEPGGYKTETRAKHPNEPFARAIRAMKEEL